MRISNWAKASAALIAGAGLVLAIPALPAVGEQSPPAPAIHVQSPARIGDRGAVVAVTVQFKCAAGNSVYPYVSLTEKSGDGIASGSNGALASISCKGSSQHTILEVTPSVESRPFVPGSAFAQGQITVCEALVSCQTGVSNKSIELVKS